jgi:hypothetical protein
LSIWGNFGMRNSNLTKFSRSGPLWSRYPRGQTLFLLHKDLVNFVSSLSEFSTLLC